MLVVSYIRVSSKGQIDGDGPERQRESIARFCTSHKLNLIYEAFESVSGTTEALAREAFSEMVEMIEKRKSSDPIEAVVVERMDRLARDLMVSEILLGELRKRGVKVFCADHGALTDMASNDGDPTRKLLRQMMGALAEWEKSQLVLKLRIGREHAKAMGRCIEGVRPYGVTPVEETALGIMVNCRGEGWSYDRIANALNTDGFRNRKDKKWTRQQVRGILLNKEEREKRKAKQ